MYAERHQSNFRPLINAYLALEIWGHRNVSKLQPIMHVWYMEFWAKTATLLPTMHVSYSIIRPHTHYHKDISNHNQHTLAISPMLSALNIPIH